MRNLWRRDISPGPPAKLPSRKILAGVVEDPGAVLFPNRLGRQDLAGDGVNYFVGHTLGFTMAVWFLWVEFSRTFRLCFLSELYIHDSVVLLFVLGLECW